MSDSDEQDRSDDARVDRGGDDKENPEAGGAAFADPEYMEAKYEPGKRPTVVMPGTRGAVSGTAFADQVDNADDAMKNPAVQDPAEPTVSADTDD